MDIEVLFFCLCFSEASGLIKDILTVSPAKRANIVDICSHWWVNQGCDHSLTDVAEDLANLTPVRLDFLLALAPPVTPTEVSILEPRANQKNCTGFVAYKYSTSMHDLIQNSSTSQESPTDANQENVQPSSLVASATEPVGSKPMNVLHNELPSSSNTDGMNDYASVNMSPSSVDSGTLKRRSLSVPDIAERAMDFFVAGTDKEEDNTVPQKRRDDNDSRSVIAPAEGRKKKPRMGVSALVSETCSTDDSKEADSKNQVQPDPHVIIKIMDSFYVIY